MWDQRYKMKEDKDKEKEDKYQICKIFICPVAFCVKTKRCVLLSVLLDKSPIKLIKIKGSIFKR